MTDQRGPVQVANTFHEDMYLKSSFYEQLVEHVFISEVLQEVWFRFGKVAEVLRAEVDASGYDIVLECNNVLRHVQLKTSKDGVKAERSAIRVVPKGRFEAIETTTELVRRLFNLSGVLGEVSDND